MKGRGRGVVGRDRRVERNEVGGVEEWEGGIEEWKGMRGDEN